jgi:GR25 family glycosyltransferase involved in LPS biosynthesis
MSNKNIDSVKVISLKKHEDRRSLFVENNPNLTYSFIDAIDGSVLSVDLLSNQNLFSKDVVYTLGAKGCALSHLACWNLSIKENSVVTVTEDDAIFREDFHVASQKLFSLLPDQWDIVLWGWNFDSILSLNEMPSVSPTIVHFDQNNLRKNIFDFKKMIGANFPLRLDKCFGTIAYSISPKGAELFKKECFPLSHFLMQFPSVKKIVRNDGIDIAMNQVYSGAQSYVCFPPLVVTKNVKEESTIR